MCYRRAHDLHVLACVYAEQLFLVDLLCLHRLDPPVQGGQVAAQRRRERSKSSLMLQMSPAGVVQRRRRGASGTRSG